MLNTTGLPCGRRLANLRPGSTLGLSSLPFPPRRGPTQGAVAEEPQQRGVAGAAHQLHALNSRHVHGGWAGSSGGLLVGAAAALRAALPSTLEPCGLEASDPSWRLWRTQLNRQLSDRTPASPVLAPPSCRWATSWAWATATPPTSCWTATRVGAGVGRGAWAGSLACCWKRLDGGVQVGQLACRANCLLCLHSHSRRAGKLLHIDFGDCFEASMNREKFPEKVSGPWALTAGGCWAGRNGCAQQQQ